VVWLSRYRGEAERHAELIEDARGRAASGFAFVEQALGAGRTHLVGEDFTAADVMMGFTLGAGRALGVLDERFPRLLRYFARLEARPAFRKALSGQIE
jgi:glutathione S-transferase